MLVAYGLSKIASYSSEMSESLYVTDISPVHKSLIQASLIQALRVNLP